MLCSGIVISVRITFDKKRNKDKLCCLQVFSLRFESTSTKRETRKTYVVFKYSYLGSKHLRQKRNEDKLCCLQVFSLLLELHATKRNEDMYGVLRYSHSEGINFDIREMRTFTMFSGILTRKLC
jgi:hypothetical protein